MEKYIKEYWPILSIIAIYWAVVGILLAVSINMNQGHLVYALDDPYIHMAVAKNAVQHRVWGVSRYDFSNSTSSPLWTGILAVTYLTCGLNEISPLALNLLFGTFALIILNLFLRRFILGRMIRFFILLAALFVTPFPSLTLAGMEHILHIFLTIWFLYHFMILLSPDTGRPNQIYLVVLSALIPMVRYEGLILIFVAFFLFALQKKWRFAFILLAAGLIPVTIYGFWSISKNWYFLPNSVLLKGNIPDITYSEIAKFVLGYDLFSKIQDSAHLLLLLLPALLLFKFYYKNSNLTRPKMWALAAFISATLLHVQLADTGWFFRYEAYLVLMGIAILGITIPDLIHKRPSFKFYAALRLDNLADLFFIVLIAGPFVLRAYDSIRITPDAMNNIYEQQYQMGLFLARFYQGETIAANDIGAISYLADIKLLDLWGLGSLQVAKLRLQKHYKSDQISSLAREADAPIAIVYEDWYEDFGGLPAQWFLAGSWKVPNSVVLGGEKVSFYALAPSEKERLVQSLKAFKTDLPVDIKQSGIYTLE